MNFFDANKMKEGVLNPESLDEEVLEVLECNKNAIPESHELDEDQEDKEFNDWVEDEDESLSVQDLFSSATFPSISLMMEHDKNSFDFDLKDIVQTVCKDTYEYIKLINFIRSTASTLPNISKEQVADVKNQILNKSFLEGEQYLKPVLENDPLLFIYEENFSLEEDDEEDNVQKESK
jgi:protein arginine N-methyltransferase 3